MEMLKQTVEMLVSVRFAFFGEMRTKDKIKSHPNIQTETMEWRENIVCPNQTANSSERGYSEMFAAQQAAAGERQRANPA